MSSMVQKGKKCMLIAKWLPIGWEIVAPIKFLRIVLILGLV